MVALYSYASTCLQDSWPETGFKGFECPLASVLIRTYIRTLAGGPPDFLDQFLVAQCLLFMGCQYKKKYPMPQCLVLEQDSILTLV